MKLNEILEKEKIEIEETMYGVVQYGTIDTKNIESYNEFEHPTYSAENLEDEYNNAKRYYTIYKSTETVDDFLSEEEVRSYLKTLEEKHDSI